MRDGVVVITGASAGLGRATAREFGRHGAKVGLIARGIEGLEAARREIESAGGRAMVLPLDVADANAIEGAAAAIEDEFGPIGIWVNNAMASVFSPVKEMEADEYKRVTEVTYLGVVYGTLAALKRMLPRNRGTIVQVGSALVYRSIPLQSAYCAAKHAIAGFTDSLRCELIHDKKTRRLGSGEEKAHAYVIAWLHHLMLCATVSSLFHASYAQKIIPISGEEAFCGCRARIPGKYDSARRIPSASPSSRWFD